MSRQDSSRFQQSYRRHLLAEQRREVLRALRESLDPGTTLGEIVDAAEALGWGEPFGDMSLAEIAEGLLSGKPMPADEGEGELDDEDELDDEGEPTTTPAAAAPVHPSFAEFSAQQGFDDEEDDDEEDDDEATQLSMPLVDEDEEEDEEEEPVAAPVVKKVAKKVSKKISKKAVKKQPLVVHTSKKASKKAAKKAPAAAKKTPAKKVSKKAAKKSGRR